jgi:transposase
MRHGIRSSRRLEWACKNAIDFIWLVEGRQIDHSTLCNFRNRFKKELKGIFRQLGCIAMTMGMMRLNQIALDGTKVKAIRETMRSNRKIYDSRNLICPLDYIVQRYPHTQVWAREGSENMR